MAAVSNLFESQLDRKLNKHIDKQDKGKSLHYSYDSFNSIAEVSRQLILWPRVSVIACLLSQSDCTCSFHHFKLLWLGLKKKRPMKQRWNLVLFSLTLPPSLCSIAGYLRDVLIERNFHFFLHLPLWASTLLSLVYDREFSFFLITHMSFGKPPKVSYSLGRKKMPPGFSLSSPLWITALMCSFEVTGLRLH